MRSNPARPRLLLVALVLAAMLAAACTAASGGRARRRPARPGRRGRPRPVPSLTKLEQAKEHLKHLVFIVQENRSFDHYFGTFPGAEGIPMRNGRPTVCVPDPIARHVRPSVPHERAAPGGWSARPASLGARRRRREDGRVRQDRDRQPAVLRRSPLGPEVRGLPRAAGATGRHELPHRARRSRTTGGTRRSSSCRTTCSRPRTRGRCRRTCSSCRRGPPIAPTLGTRCPAPRTCT